LSPVGDEMHCVCDADMVASKSRRRVLCESTGPISWFRDWLRPEYRRPIGDNSLRVSQPLTGDDSSVQGCRVKSEHRNRGHRHLERSDILSRCIVQFRCACNGCPTRPFALAFRGCRGLGSCSYGVRDLDASTTISENVVVAASAQIRLDANGLHQWHESAADRQRHPQRDWDLAPLSLTLVVYAGCCSKARGER